MVCGCMHRIVGLYSKVAILSVSLIYTVDNRQYGFFGGGHCSCVVDTIILMFPGTEYSKIIRGI